jgi:peptidoglycan/LPS O-acetylase OafA/YrhL
MTSLGNQIASDRSNNLNAIRLMLALAVVLSHAFPLTLGWGGETKGEPLAALTHQQESFGYVAVNLFFLISGFLITASWLRSKSMQDYLMKRILRIYPGFIVAVGFSAAMVWIFCPEFRAGVGHGISWGLVMIKDWVFLTNSSIWRPGIFAQNPLPVAANGSLWTIPIEFSCYLLVALIGLLCLFKHRILILIATLLVFLSYAKSIIQGDDLGHLDSRFLTYFMVGMTYWLWRNKIPFSKWIAFVGVAMLLMASQFKPWFSLIFPAVGGYCILWLGYGPNIKYLDWTVKTDLSYGTYLYAFPVQQVVAMNEALRYPWINFLIATPVTLLLAWLSWHMVEKRFLAMKSIALKDLDPGIEMRSA